MDTGTEFDPKKHSIILLHGSGQSHVVWSLTTQYLSDQNFNVFAIDFPGHGNSEGECLKTIEEMAVWLEKVINKIDNNELSWDDLLLSNKIPESVIEYIDNSEQSTSMICMKYISLRTMH